MAPRIFEAREELLFESGGVAIANLFARSMQLIK
jgi:hypothetical protein